LREGRADTGGPPPPTFCVPLRVADGNRGGGGTPIPDVTNSRGRQIVRSGAGAGRVCVGDNEGGEVPAARWEPRGTEAVAWAAFRWDGLGCEEDLGGAGGSALIHLPRELPLAIWWGGG